MNLDIRVYNRAAWDRQVEMGNPWTRPVTSAQIAAARRGEWSVVLTENRPVPPAWFPPLAGRAVLCLASGGGQQAPILAAAGARVTVLDNSPRQLARDREVAERDGLGLTTVLGDMADLSAFADQSFDLVFHPVSNLFAAEVRPVWREAFRVLRRGGALLAGFMNPAFYIFDLQAAEQGRLEVRFKLPYSDKGSLPPEELQRFLDAGSPLEHSHSLEDQIGGQLEAGFHLTALYEDRHRDIVIGEYLPTYLATRAVKP
jgi:SAM-dependent methyltransferase